MIYKLYPQSVAGIFKTLCHLYILLARSNRTRRVIMSHYDRCCPVGYRVGKYLPWMHLHIVNQSTDTTLVAITSLAPFNDTQTKCSCLRFAKYEIKGNISQAEVIFIPSGLILRLANSRAAQ